LITSGAQTCGTSGLTQLPSFGIASGSARQDRRSVEYRVGTLTPSPFVA